MFSFKIKRLIRWILFFFAFVLLYFLLPNNLFSNFQPQIQPWLDANQELRNVTLMFQNFNQSYHIISSKHSDICAEKQGLILVASSPENSKTRKLIRQSWANKTVIPNDFLILFVIGTQTNYDIEMDLYVEKHDFDDLIRYDLSDTYENLIFKTHAMFSWQKTFCPNVKYVIKINDDTVVDLERIDKFIKNELMNDYEKDAIFCRPQSQVLQYRNPFSRWYASYSNYNKSSYPKYCHSGMYMMNSDVVSKILENTKDKQLLRAEDLFFTGIMASHFNISLHSSLTFCNKQNEIDDLCKNGTNFQIAAHCNAPRENIPQIYENLKQSQCNGSSKIYPFQFSLLFIVISFMY